MCIRRHYTEDYIKEIENDNVKLDSVWLGVTEIAIIT